MDLTDYLAKKEELDRCKRDQGKAQGRLEAVLQRLQTECDCTTEEKGKRKLTALKKQLADLESQYQQELDQYEKDYKDKLGG